MSDDERRPPKLSKLPYEESDLKDLWQKCVDYEKRWREESSCSEKMRKSMASFKERKTIRVVWLSNKLEGTLPRGASEWETYNRLTSLLTSARDRKTAADVSVPRDAVTVEGKDSDDRESKQQMVQHLQAYLHLTRQHAETQGLSCRLILETHEILMNGLRNDGKLVKAGEYRTGPVSAGYREFPSHECVPENMPIIVKEYNERFSTPHDPYDLASWLLYQVISLHPFEDGNGRLCRLLWCYSLICDGLPFPTVLTSGKTKAYRHYIQALQKSQRSYEEDYSPITSLTVISAYLAWQNFFSNWDKYERGQG